MDTYRELGERLRSLRQEPRLIFQGIVLSTEGSTCTVDIEGLAIPDIRLRASLQNEDEELLVIPKIGSAVIVASLSGDLNELVVLSVDRAEEIRFHGGHQGGLVLVRELCTKLNALEEEVNNLKDKLRSWTPTPQDGGASLKASISSWARQSLAKTKSEDLENPYIKQ